MGSREAIKLFRFFLYFVLNVFPDGRGLKRNIRAHLVFGECVGLQRFAIGRQVNWKDALARQECVDC